MKIELYDALTGINIPAATAKVVVESVQENIDMQVSRASEAVVAKIDGLSSKIDALVLGRIVPLETAEQMRISRVRWVVGTALTMIGLACAIAGTLHAFHII